MFDIYVAGLSRKVHVYDVGKHSILIPESLPHKELSLLIDDLWTGCRLKFGLHTSCVALFSSAG